MFYCLLRLILGFLLEWMFLLLRKRFFPLIVIVLGGLLALAILLQPIHPSHAQEEAPPPAAEIQQPAQPQAPATLNTVLEDLSARVGQPITLRDVENWTWEQIAFADTSLDCPLPDRVYLQVRTVGVHFTITYRDINYDYRVSNDGRTVILCGTVVIRTPQAPTPQPGLPALVDTDNGEACAAALEPRLAVGSPGRVTIAQPSNLRELPSQSATALGEIVRGGVFTVMNGPECGAGLVWWRVNYNGREGWIAEGRNNDYFLEPVLTLMAPIGDRAPISTENARTLSEMSRINGAFGTDFEWMPQETAFASPLRLAVTASGDQNGVWIYDLSDIAAPPRLLESQEAVTTVTFNPVDSNMIAFGRTQVGIVRTDGTVRIWDVDRSREQGGENTVLQNGTLAPNALAFNTNGTWLAAANGSSFAPVPENIIRIWRTDTWEQLSESQYTYPVLDIAFSADGRLFAYGDLSGGVNLLQTRAGGGTVTLEGHEAAIRAVAFTPANAPIPLLASGSEDSTVRLWNTNNGRMTQLLQSPTSTVLAVAFSPDGTLIATGGGNQNIANEDYAVRVWNVVTGNLLATLVGHAAPVTDLAFSPDGTLLASMGNDHVLRFWGIPASGLDAN